MKFILIFSLLAFGLLTEAKEIKIHRMEPDGEIERSYVLGTNIDEKVVLDCQSFILGLRVGEYEDALFYVMFQEQCMDLKERIQESLNQSKNHCLEVNLDVDSDGPC